MGQSLNGQSSAVTFTHVLQFGASDLTDSLASKIAPGFAILVPSDRDVVHTELFTALIAAHNLHRATLVSILAGMGKGSQGPPLVESWSQKLLREGDSVFFRDKPPDRMPMTQWPSL